MNRALLNPFEALKLPDKCESYLDVEGAKSTCFAFNRQGNVLAVGLDNGKVALWDFDTRSSDQSPAVFVSTTDPPGTYITTQVAFCAPGVGHCIAASFKAKAQSAHKGLIRIYESLSSKVLCELRFPIPIASFVPHPVRANVFIVIPPSNLPFVVDAAPGEFDMSVKITYQLVPQRFFEVETVKDGIEATAPADQVSNVKRKHCSTAWILGSRRIGAKTASSAADDDHATGNGESNGTGAEITASGTTAGGSRKRPETYVVAVSEEGDLVFRGGPDGFVHVFDAVKVRTETEDVGIATDSESDCINCRGSFRVPGGAAIKTIICNRSHLLVNSGDRTMRRFDVQEVRQRVNGANSTGPSVQAAYTEAVNRLQCRSACFSVDGDFVLGGMAGNEHRIHVWRTLDGHLETTLEGPTEGVANLLWHPVQPVIVSLGSGLGGVYVWAKNFTENWSAFAPDFTELEANEEYEEREDEFDAKDPLDDARVRIQREKAEESIMVDVESCDDQDLFAAHQSFTDKPSTKAEVSRAVLGYFQRSTDPFFYLPAHPIPDMNLPPLPGPDMATQARHAQ